MTDAAGPAQAIVQRINSFWDGKRLSGGIREQMIDYARQAINTRQGDYDQVTDQMRGIAQQRGVNPDRSALEFRTGRQPPAGSLRCRCATANGSGCHAAPLRSDGADPARRGATPAL